MTDPTGRPERIGPYRVLRKLGEGAMGVVYLAEQSEPLRREVALKILKPGMDTAQVVARFQAERQALAVMEHPGIARVFDAGQTEAGRPYFVMEHVAGTPITRWCDENRVGLRDRVELFTQICRAVQHAHQKGVIHRDLKPSNVLVTTAEDGTPRAKVIDFGIARAVEPADAVRLTAVDQSIGTPAYMSPEQARASDLDVDTRTDIYSLGVLLYELLAGALPFDPAAYRGWAFLAHHLEKEPPRPSERVREIEDPGAVAAARGTTPDQLRRELSGDLDWIVMKAMEKDRERRYETANGLAMDVERYLDAEPVVARPPSASYRAAKFVRRHRVGVAAAAVFVLLLAGFGATMAVQARRIAAARNVAESRREQAEGLIDFMLGDLRAKLAPMGRLEILDDVGAQAIAYFAAIPESEFSDAELLSRSRSLAQIGQVRIEEGRAQEAQEALSESLRLARELSGRAPEDTDRLFQLSQSYFWVGYAAWRRDDLAMAERQFLGYLDAAQRLVELEPDNPAYHLELGFAHSNLGSVREGRGDLDGAAAAFRLTLGVLDELVRANPENADWLGELAESHNKLAVIYRKQGRYADALAEHQEELALKEQLVELVPGHAYWRSRLGYTHHFIADLQALMGRLGPAEASARTAVAIADSLTRHDPGNAAWRQDLARTQWNLGETLAVRGRRDESLSALAAAQRELEALLQTDSTAFDWRPSLGAVHGARARALLQLGDPAAAIGEARTALRLLEGSATETVMRIRNRAQAELALGRALLRTGEDHEAAVVLEAALARLRAAGPEAAVELRPVLAEALILTGSRAAAEARLDTLRDLGYRHPVLLELAARYDYDIGV